MWTRTTKLIIFTAVACSGLLLFTVFFSSDGAFGEPIFKAKEGEIVAIYSKHAGKYLEVSPHDGKLRATASTPTNKTALFRVMLLTPSVVDILVDAAKTANNAEWSKRRFWTGAQLDENGTSAPGDKGCQCSGYSNDHGFGSYCFGWEYESQVPWCAPAHAASESTCPALVLSMSLLTPLLSPARGRCYVTDTCSLETRGSFGRKFAECAMVDEFPLTTSPTDYREGQVRTLPRSPQISPNLPKPPTASLGPSLTFVHPPHALRDQPDWLQTDPDYAGDDNFDPYTRHTITALNATWHPDSRLASAPHAIPTPALLRRHMASQLPPCFGATCHPNSRLASAPHAIPTPRLCFGDAWHPSTPCLLW